MIATVKAKRIEIFINSEKKTMAQIKQDLGCSHIINGGLFESPWRPCCQLKAGGKTYVNDGYKYWGYAWDTAADLRMCEIPCEAQNYIACVDLVRDSKPGDLNYNSQIGGRRQRTAIGRLPDGRIILYCTQAGRTPEQVRDEFLAKGAESALMLDGGGSSQCDFNGFTLTASRIVHNFIAVWEDDSEDPGNNDEEGDQVILTIGSSGDAVYTLQSQLNMLNCGPLTLDGQYGAATAAAVKKFQQFYSLGADGIAGPATLERLERGMRYIDSENPLIRAAANSIGISEPKGDDGIIKEFIALSGLNLSMDAPWCQVFAVVMQQHAGLNPYISASCTQAMNYYQDAGRWSSEAQAGRLAYLDWDLSSDADHVGIVAEVDGGNIYVIEGNSAGEGEDAVRLKVYSETDKRIRGYAIVDALQAETPATFTQAEFDAMMANWLQRHSLVVSVKS